MSQGEFDFGEDYEEEFDPEDFELRDEDTQDRLRKMMESWGIDTRGWAFSSSKIPPKPEVPQVPDIAHQVPCKNCRHTLASHELKEMFFGPSKVDPDHTRLSWEWSCMGLACTCRVFQPKPEQVQGLRQSPPF